MEISLSVQQERVFIRADSNDRTPNRIKCVHKEGGGLGKLLELDLDAICDGFRMVFWIIFRIFTSEPVSDGISDAFQIFGLEIKKKY